MERVDSLQQHAQQVTGVEEQKTPVAEQEVTAITPAASNSNIKNRVPLSQSRLLPVVVIGVLLGAGAIASGIYAYRQWQYSQSFPQTDNAYITADIYPVTARVSGIVNQIPVNENQVVTPGTLLVKLDPQDYQVSLTQAKASLELAKQQAALAQKKFKNVPVSASVPRLLPADNNTQARQNFLQAQAAQQRDINEQQYKTALAAIAQKEAEVKKAELQLSYTNINALVPGKIGNKNIQIGQRVEPGQTLFTVVQPDPWIIGNFQESQLEKIQQGQRVDIKIAAFPSRNFAGKVDSIALIPPNNNTNTKDVRRIPVKIMFDPASIKGYESRITPGMSAVVKVTGK
ncbi:MAG: HlyD family secretion protein [Pelatocladus maniniholoensis HA4357-MV3]|uniref:HlyD family secretion protein n=1 Tax=Pelatocladus maniniholoensis HA4357-MV3 TaxID=1117104 RepID=A0A9E3H8V1_9NOST|nr:HlyD family secretion protein [Pelatocladus maniniholoensis HA4357-MV3]BAZ68372.1 HlyD family secretion protein [Fischerella sp. NIES-4106]